MRTTPPIQYQLTQWNAFAHACVRTCIFAGRRLISLLGLWMPPELPRRFTCSLALPPPRPLDLRNSCTRCWLLNLAQNHRYGLLSTNISMSLISWCFEEDLTMPYRRRKGKFIFEIRSSCRRPARSNYA